MKEIEFFKPNIGDTVWFANGEGLDNLTSGTCVNIFEHGGSLVYVMVSIIPGIGEYHYEAREDDYISPGPDKPLNWIKRMKELNYEKSTYFITKT